MKKFTSVLLILSFLSIALFGCYSPDQILANEMIEKYSDNNNYVELSGEVVEFDNNYIIIKCEELKEYIGYEDDFCDYQIYSDKVLDLNVGDKIDFITVPFHFYNGHRLPIVELIKDGETLLILEEGKANLIEWVNTTFK